MAATYFTKKRRVELWDQLIVDAIIVLVDDARLFIADTSGRAAGLNGETHASVRHVVLFFWE